VRPSDDVFGKSLASCGWVAPLPSIVYSRSATISTICDAVVVV
jgi:hypothetical protein